MGKDSSMQSVYYCLPGKEKELLEALIHDDEFTEQLWVTANDQFPVGFECRLESTEQSSQCLKELFDRLIQLDGGEQLTDALLEYSSKEDDERMDFAKEMFIKGLVYGFAYLGRALHERNQRIEAS